MDAPPPQALPIDDRPRERLWSLGGERVSDAELLAIVIGTGRPGRNATSVAHDVLAAVGGVAGLARAWPQELAAVNGLGPAQAARLVAAMTLGGRGIERTRGQLGVLHCADDVRFRMWPKLAGLEQEVFYVIGIDARNAVVIEREIARGHLTGVDVHPREVFRPLIRAGVAAAVCVHNHPSGDPTPSGPDVMLTRRLREAGELLGVPLVDHIVVADGGAVSIAEWMSVPGDGPAGDAP